MMNVSRLVCQLLSFLLGAPEACWLVPARPPEAEALDLSFSKTWHILGPFQIGTREAAWGSDPLEYLGGFRALHYNASDTYWTSIGFNGTTTWSSVEARVTESRNGSAMAELDVDFPGIDWQFFRNTHGWAAVQWQAWARGEISVTCDHDQVLRLYSDYVLEFWINDTHYYGGDFFAFERTPTILHLPVGKHRLRIDVRLVRDIRSMGAPKSPLLGVRLILERGQHGLVKGLRPGTADVLVSDVLLGIGLISPHVSMVLRNEGLQKQLIRSVSVNHSDCHAAIANSNGRPFALAQGQSRSLALHLTCKPAFPLPDSLSIDIAYNSVLQQDLAVVSFQVDPTPRKIRDMQRLTFVHPAGVVSYAVLRPPATESCSNANPVPILLVLHGAGVDVDDETMKHALDKLPNTCAWILYPTGGTTWSGDDWHQWGLPDVEAAIAAIPAWIETTKWQGPGVDVDSWVVMGHSNGGQGAWYLLTHRPDKVIAVAALSGYSSVQNYIPYTLWQSADPSRTAILQAALTSYSHELLLENAKGIPVFQQHGSLDDNVPPYLSRLLRQRAWLADVSSTYFEVPEHPHWWDGIMTTPPLMRFIETHINETKHASLPYADFTIITANHGDMGSKNGVEIVALRTSGQLGSLRFSLDSHTFSCKFVTSNVRAVQLSSLYEQCKTIFFDGQRIVFGPKNRLEHLVKSVHGLWQCAGADEPPLPPRRALQLGPIDSILRSRGAIHIVPFSPPSDQVALQVSNNLFQYFAADTVITHNYDFAVSNATWNVITLGIGNHFPKHRFGYHHAIRIVDSKLELVDVSGRVIHYPSHHGLAAIFLRPIPEGRLELAIWGVDEESLRLAARLIPLMAGTGQPDFVIMDKTTLWKGLNGALALGFFDEWWRTSRCAHIG